MLFSLTAFPPRVNRLMTGIKLAPVELLNSQLLHRLYGRTVEVSEIRAAYDKAIGRKTHPTQIYQVLRRHGWRKVMPRSKHLKKASDEAIKASKKLNPK